MSKWFNYCRPIFDCHFAKELWFDDLGDNQFYFHLFCIQLRKKDKNSIVITVLGFTCLITSLAFSDFVDSYLTGILNKPTEGNQNV